MLLVYNVFMLFCALDAVKGMNINMLKKEQRYEFKRELLQIHKKDRRDPSLKARNDEFIINDDFAIVVPQNCDAIILTAAKDFADYLLTSMQISARVSYVKPEDKAHIDLSLNQNIEEASGYMGYRITVADEGITIEGYDSRGIAQGLYFLEDLMNLRRAPYLDKRVIKRKALFSPRFAQSPFGMFEFTDECLSYMAHLGYDAIDLWIKGYNVNLRGDYIDMPLLCERAEKYGIKIYIELYAENTAHPEDDDAEEFYDNLYGKLFKSCPKLSGVMVEGECSNFQSRDPTVGKAPTWKNYDDNIPTGKISPGWWPCCDYPQWIDLIKKSVRRYKADADIIFCSYNWGYAPEEDRIRLIEALPNDISLMVAWDNYQQYKVGNTIQNVEDYSLGFVGPSDSFMSEAVAAKKKGMQLYAIANTAGRTWDFGVIPYEPMPYQWIKRYEKMIEVHNDYNLMGITECIHYGFHPSFIGELEKWAFFTHEEDLRDVLLGLLKRDFGDKNIDAVDKAMHLWSEAITHYVPTNEDQYGVFRTGPSFPFWLSNTKSYPDNGRIPNEGNVMFGNAIFFEEYTPDIRAHNSFSSIRLVDELHELEILASLLKEGIDVLKAIENPNENLLKLINLGEFMYHTSISAINMKKFYVLRHKIHIADTTQLLENLLDDVEELLLFERENAEKTIPIVQFDSRLGWEPSMEYMGDEKCIRWKLRQLDYELTNTLPIYRKAINLEI